MPLPVLSVAQMRAAETATWATGQTEAEVIRLFGKKIARRVRKLTRNSWKTATHRFWKYFCPIPICSRWKPRCKQNPQSLWTDCSAPV